MDFKKKTHLKRKNDVCNCRSQSEDTNSLVLYVEKEFMRGRAMKTDPQYLLVSLCHTIPKIWLRKMVMWQMLSWEVYSRILFKCAAWGSRIFSNSADILTQVMHLYSTEGATGEFIVISVVL